MKRALVFVAIAATTAAASPRKRPAPTPDARPKPAEPAPPPAPLPAPAPEMPWSVGVPLAVQARANALYDEGNQLFVQQAHAPALEKYKQALALWDHPLIRFNLAVTDLRAPSLRDRYDSVAAPYFVRKPRKGGLFSRLLGGE